eukprot:3061535-Pyramimonas_sp.AAC.1
MRAVRVRRRRERAVDRRGGGTPYTRGGLRRGVTSQAAAVPGHVPAVRVGVRAAEHHEHGAVQAQAERARDGQARARLGRPAPAYAQWAATPGGPACRHQHLLRLRRHHPQREHGTLTLALTLTLLRLRRHHPHREQGKRCRR